MFFKKYFLPALLYIIDFEISRVRNGNSRSYLEVGFGGRWALFSGWLDFKTLGGAGFASQQTLFHKSTETEDEKGLDLTSFDGIFMRVLKGDGKTYSLNIKDQVGEVVDAQTGKRASVLEFKFLFTPEARFDSEVEELGGCSSHPLSATSDYYIPFSKFVPYYRGRPLETYALYNPDSKQQPEYRQLNIGNIRTLSIMCASLFGKQSGTFSLMLESISAYKNKL